MVEIVRLLFGTIRLLLVGNALVRILVILTVGGVVGYIVVAERKRNGELSSHAFQAVTLMHETDTLRIIPRGVSTPGNIRSRLRAFDSGDEIYDYVYKKFDEALFRKILIHRSDNTSPAEYVTDTDATEETNRAHLNDLLRGI